MTGGRYAIQKSRRDGRNGLMINQQITMLANLICLGEIGSS
ncbi:hypothetical protein [Belliella calami]|nr:hypothetical protein [Belliella calami]